MAYLWLILSGACSVALKAAGSFGHGLLSGAEPISAARMAGAAFIAIGVFLLSK